MNWTEGALARHSRRKGWNEEATRQKQYFARARANLRPGQPKPSKNASAFVPDYIPQRKESAMAALPGFKHPQTSRKRLIHTISEPSEAVHNEDQSLSDSRLDSSGNSWMHQPACSTDLDRKRQKLLEKSDWTGVEIQKPLVVDFSWRNDYKNNTNPSHKTHGHLSRRSPSYRLGRDRRIQQAPSSRSMRLRIGTQDFRWSRQSNSVRSPVCVRSPLSQRGTESQSGSSDYSQSLTALHARKGPGRPVVEAARSYSPRRKQTRSQHNIGDKDSHGTADLGPQLHPHIGETQFVALSAPPLIYHPQPKREGWERLLLRTMSPDSDITDSVYAQPDGSNHPDIGLEKENARWREWLGSDVGNSSVNQDLNPSPAPISSALSTLGNSRDSEEVQVPSSSMTIMLSEHDGEPSQISCNPARQSKHQTTSFSQSNTAQKASTMPEGSTPWITISRRPTAEVIPKPSAAASDTRPTQGEIPASTDSPHNDILCTNEELPRGPDVQNLLDLLAADLGEANNKDYAEDSTKPEPSRDADEDEIWRKFILYDDDEDLEIKRKAQLVAREQTKRELRPPPEPWASDVAQPPSSTDYDDMIYTTNYADGCDGSLSSSSETPVQITVSTTDNVASSRDAAHSLVAQQGSPLTTPIKRKSDFKFHQPQLFVGRLATVALDAQLLTGTPPPPQPALPATKRGRGHRSRKRRGTSGRPDFRAMPDLEGDPIEDFC